MKTKIFTLFLAAFMLLAMNLQAKTVTVGTTGTYASINLTIAGENALGSLTEPLIIELQQGYNGPDAISSVNGASVTNTVTIRPEATATNMNVSGGGLIVWSMSNCQYINIDGRPGGIGASVLTLTADTLTTDRPAALNITNSSNCTISYVTLKAATINNTGAWVNGTTIAPTVGVVNIASGVTNLTIDNCNITGLNSIRTPTIGIISIGSSSAVNSGLVISNNNFYDIYSRDLSKCATVASTGVGVLLSDFTTTSTVSGNSFY
ncbi:MAG: hypothetical protein Q7U47_11910 [Paludibacter sp.]|nr:hypothetical protein [Paludibacter sp.]